jgi:hypothetical protein
VKSTAGGPGGATVPGRGSADRQGGAGHHPHIHHRLLRRLQVSYIIHIQSTALIRIGSTGYFDSSKL